MNKKVFISGCFDLLHSGHIAFFEEAAKYGELYVALGSDDTIYNLKGRLPICNENERLYMIKSLSCVHEAFIASGSGILDFKEELRNIQPDIFIVNEDGDYPLKKNLCESLGIEYVILRRVPSPGLEPRSTTGLRSMSRIPYRIDLAGGWLDQPFVSKLHSGPVITVSIEPIINFNERSGMASSTRRSAIDLWDYDIPIGDYEKLAKILFCYDNPPGTKDISGSQDSIGIVIPGLNRSFYSGQYWPDSIDKVGDEPILQFLERSIYLIPLGPRCNGYHPLTEVNINKDDACKLSVASNECWSAILNSDIVGFGKAVRESFEAQISMFPNMVTSSIRDHIEKFKDVALGWKLSGAGGGGYIILISDKNIGGAIKIEIRRY